MEKKNRKVGIVLCLFLIGFLIACGTVYLWQGENQENFKRHIGTIKTMYSKQGIDSYWILLMDNGDYVSVNRDIYTNFTHGNIFYYYTFNIINRSDYSIPEWTFTCHDDPKPRPENHKLIYWQKYISMTYYPAYEIYNVSFENESVLIKADSSYVHYKFKEWIFGQHYYLYLVPISENNPFNVEVYDVGTWGHHTDER